MNNLESWAYGVPMPNIISYERLKQDICEHAKRDYVFFPFLIGYAQRYLNEVGITDSVRNCVFNANYLSKSLKDSI